MHPDDLGGASGRRGDFRDRKRRGVRRENRGRRTDSIGRLEDLRLQLQNLGNRLDDEIGVPRRGLEIGLRSQSGEGRGFIRLAQGSLLYLAVQILADRSDRKRQAPRVDVDERRLEAGLSEDMGDAVSHLTTAHHGYVLDIHRGVF